MRLSGGFTLIEMRIVVRSGIQCVHAAGVYEIRLYRVPVQERIMNE